jgi:penicillin-binding protein 2
VQRQHQAVRVTNWQQNLLQSNRSRVRLWPFTIVLILMGVVSVSRLAQLTMVEGAYFRTRSDNNRIISVRTTAARGVFYDRHQQPLVRNLPAFKRQVPGTTLAQGMFEPISKEDALALSGNSQRIYYDITRDYLCSRACSLLLGYVSEVDAQTLSELSQEYIAGDSVGKAGLEKVFEERVRGMPGNQLIEVNARGQVERILGENQSTPGTDIKTTIDKQLQELSFELMASYSGAVVALEPKSGEILAMMSTPAFDPNNIALGLQEPNQPFFNRALAGVYPPGSVYKIVTSVAALESGKIDADSQFQDSGEIRVGDFSFGNWLYAEHGRTEGAVNVVKALQRSNDIYFYRIGEQIGPDLMAEWSMMFGLGQAPNISGLIGAAGTIPTPKWKEKTKGERWYLGNTFHMSIGQGDVLTSPVQVAMMMSAIAAEGTLCPPSLVRDSTNTPGCTQLNLSEETLRSVQEGLVAACKPGGTGAPFFDSDYEVACKTGTAQQGGEDALPHAWFTVYAPAKDPEIVIAILAEKAGQGSQEAAPVAKRLLDWWFAQPEEYRTTK